MKYTGIAMFLFLTLTGGLHAQTTITNSGSGNTTVGDIAGGNINKINNTYIVGDTSHHNSSDNAPGKPGQAGQPCPDRETGDYCFENATQYPLTIYLYLPNVSRNNLQITLTIAPGETQCSYGLKPVVYNYQGFYYQPGKYGKEQKEVNGQVQVVPCVNKRRVIRPM